MFAPFVLGVLDLAVGWFVYEESVCAGRLHVVEGFVRDLSRHG